MTNQEAKLILESNAVPIFPLELPYRDWVDAVKMAVEALEQKNELADMIRRIEALNPVDYGGIGSYEAHEGAKEMKRDILNILGED